MVPITDGRNGLLRSGLLCDNDADELVVTQPSAVASVGPNGGNRYRKCDDPKSVLPSVHRYIINRSSGGRMHARTAN